MFGHLDILQRDESGQKIKLDDDYDDDEEDYDDDDEEGIDFARQAGVIRRPSTLGTHFSSVSSDNRNMRAGIIVIIDNCCVIF